MLQNLDDKRVIVSSAQPTVPNKLKRSLICGSVMNGWR